MAQIRQLRQRVRSVSSTAKITRAQEMIATSRITKAQQAVAASKPYSDQITAALTALVSHHVGIDHPLLREQPA
ncbi:F0F1 ATP synthase subunit gamma, partial [Actinomadura adrarensis]